MGVRADIVAYCRDAIGCSYDYTPSSGVEGESYNCSFLTYCAYKAAGLEIPTWQGHQNGEGSQSDWVRAAGNWTSDPSELRAGDLVFFGSSPYYTTHVGVSLGGRDMIDSVPNGGVQERELYDSFVGGGWPFDTDEGAAYLRCNGTVRFLYDMNVRERPTTASAAFARAGAGETRNVDRIYIADGGAWCHWLGSTSGRDCYVCMTKDGTDFAEIV